MLETHNIDLVGAPRGHASTSDFRVGRYRLIPHLGIKGICVLDVDSALYARALLLRAPSPLSNGWVPLFVCETCADVGCGAMSVRVEIDADVVVWRDFGFTGPGDEGPAARAPHVARTGPFRFALDDYHRLLVPFAG